MTTEINNNSLIVPSLTATNISVTGNIYSQGGLEVGSGGTASVYVENGKVGVNTETPNEHLTVVGNISATGLFYASGGDSSKWNSSFSTVQANSATEWTSAITTTYSQLTSLKSSNSLVPGQTYIISDFQTKWWRQRMGDSTVMTSPIIEPLLVTATSNNQIHSIAKSSLYPQDIITYDINQLGSDFQSQDEVNAMVPIPQNKGWICRRQDTVKNISLPTDWRHVTVPCYRLNTSTIQSWSSASTYTKGAVVKHNGYLYSSLINSNLNNAPINNQTNNTWRRLTNFKETEEYYHVVNTSFGINLANPGNTSSFAVTYDVNSYIEQPIFTSSVLAQGIFTVGSQTKNIFANNGAVNNIFAGSNVDVVVESDSYGNIFEEMYETKIGKWSTNNRFFSVNFLQIGSNCSYNFISNGEGIRINDSNSQLTCYGGYGLDLDYETFNNYLHQCQYSKFGKEMNQCRFVGGTYSCNFNAAMTGQYFYTSQVKFLTIDTRLSTGIDYTLATHVYANYPKRITANSVGNAILTYLNASNVPQYVSVTS